MRLSIHSRCIWNNNDPHKWGEPGSQYWPHNWILGGNVPDVGLCFAGFSKCGIMQLPCLAIWQSKGQLSAKLAGDPKTEAAFSYVFSGPPECLHYRVPITVLPSSLLLLSHNDAHCFFLVSCRLHCTNVILKSVPQTLEYIKNIWRTCHKCKFLEHASESLIPKTWNGTWEPEFLLRTPVIWRTVASKTKLGRLFWRWEKGAGVPSLGSSALRKADTCRVLSRKRMALHPTISPQAPLPLVFKGIPDKSCNE